MSEKKEKKEIRIEKKVKIPEGVEINIDGKRVEVRGSKGIVIRDFSNPAFDKDVKIERVGDEVVISAKKTRRKIKAFVGTIAAKLKNMFIGVTKGYRYEMKIYYVHFPISVETKKIGNETEIIIKNFLGEKKPRKVSVKDVEVEVLKDTIILRGSDNETLGNAAGKIEYATKIKGKDRRIFNDGIFLFKKEIDTG
jgi:large subunit ribosomal protein L6